MRIVKEENNYSENINRVVAISAGGTGGHIFPALAIAKILIQEGFYVIFYTDKKFFNYIKQEDVFLRSGMIEIVQLTAKNASRWKQIFMIIEDLFLCKKILTKKVSICIGFGGLVSFAPVMFSILT
jgi:UDP-N-acetylglucosamine--N-acetylmuramyl-(pentapeptide) pyrophosphoryl-undecaprenol N-acetylglucosamine transferase